MMSAVCVRRPFLLERTMQLYDKSKLNRTLDHVPDDIRQELERAVPWLLENTQVPIAMVILFGSYARGDFVNDVRYNEDGMKSEYHSDVDVLVIQHGKGTTSQEKKLKKLLDTLKANPDFQSPFHLIAENEGRFTSALKKGEYFYLDVIKEGIVLFDDGLEIPNPQVLKPEQRRELSIRYFEKFFDKASAFQTNFEFNYQNNRLQLAIYNLHQTCEHLFATYLAVRTLYRPRTHDLYKLRAEVKKLDRQIESIFPTQSDTDGKDFGFFSSAYVDARYLLEYHVDPERLDKLTQWTANFQKWVYEQSLDLINAILPEQPYANDYTLKYRLLDLDELKNKPLPEAALAIAEDERDQALKREAELRQRLKDAGLE